jgi:hypothetical protein
MAEQNGWLLTKDWAEYTSIDPVMSLPSFSDKNMIDARRFLLDQIRVKSKIKRIVTATKQGRLVEATNEVKKMLMDFPQTVRRLYNLLRHRV